MALPQETIDEITRYAIAKHLTPNLCLWTLEELHRLLNPGGQGDFAIGLHYDPGLVVIYRCRQSITDVPYFVRGLGALNALNSDELRRYADKLRDAPGEANEWEGTHWLRFGDEPEREDPRSVEQAAAELDEDLCRIQELVS